MRKMSEDEKYEANMTAKQKEAVRKLRTKIPVENPQEITVTAELDPKIMAKNAWFNEQAERLASELREQGVEIDSSEINPSNFKGKVSELQGLKDAHRQASIDADPTRKASSGTLTLSGQSNTGSGTEFASQAEMIEELQRREKSGKTAEIREESSKILNFLWTKMLKGKKGKARHEGFDDLQDEGEGLLEKFQKEYRKRRGIK